MLDCIDYMKIGSGSKGNAILVQTKILLDVGVAYTKIAKYLKYIKIIFIGHQHKDHLLPSTIQRIAYNYPNIKFVTSSSDVVTKLKNASVPKKNIFYLKPQKWYSLGIMKVKTEPLVHDVENYGLKWEFEGKKGFYATDTSNLDGIEAKGYDLYLIENNYREDILQEHLSQAIENNDENKIYYLQRTMRTHLSKSKCDGFLIENMSSNSIYEYVHLSKYNNTETGDFDK